MRRNSSIAILLCIVCAAARAQGPAASPQPPFTAEDAARGLQLAELSLELRKQIGDFMAPAEPFKIVGNLYFVGVANGESYLLTSPEGHILFGAGFEKTAAQVEANIAALGFELTDVRAILLNHWHGDQSGATAYLKQRSGALVMAGFGEIPFIERPGGAPTGVSTSVPERPANAQGEDSAPSSAFAPFPSPQFRGIHNYPPVKVDRALFNGDVVEVGPLSVTAYLAPGHTASSTSFLYTVRDDGREYRVFQWCCWELPDDYSRSPYLSEAGVRHTLALYRELLPIDIYLETGSYAWSGILNQASGTWAERMARLREDGAPWVNRDIFRSLAAAREVSFEQLLQRLERAGTHPAYAAP